MLGEDNSIKNFGSFPKFLLPECVLLGLIAIGRKFLGIKNGAKFGNIYIKPLIKINFLVVLKRLNAKPLPIDS
jgi:hypothetical protein